MISHYMYIMPVRGAEGDEHGERGECDMAKRSERLCTTNYKHAVRTWRTWRALWKRIAVSTTDAIAMILLRTGSWALWNARDVCSFMWFKCQFECDQEWVFAASDEHYFSLVRRVMIMSSAKVAMLQCIHVSTVWSAEVQYTRKEMLQCGQLRGTSKQHSRGEIRYIMVMNSADMQHWTV